VNKRRLRAVAKRILKYPDTYIQTEWGRHNPDAPRKGYPRGLCGTTACIAGHAYNFIIKFIENDGEV
jgi:hypothetical protein